MEAVFEMAQNFFTAVHVLHNANNKKTVAIPGYFFFKCQQLQAKEWVTEQAARIYTAVQAQNDSAQQLVTTPKTYLKMRVIFRPSEAGYDLLTKGEHQTPTTAREHDEQ